MKVVQVNCHFDIKSEERIQYWMDKQDEILGEKCHEYHILISLLNMYDINKAKLHAHSLGRTPTWKHVSSRDYTKLSKSEKKLLRGWISEGVNWINGIAGADCFSKLISEGKLGKFL